MNYLYIKWIFLEQNNSSSAYYHPPDLDDVRESVRQGVTKVAGKISSLANGVMSTIQVSKLLIDGINELIVFFSCARIDMDTNINIIK